MRNNDSALWIGGSCAARRGAELISVGLTLTDLILRTVTYITQSKIA
jgi:hypothetical protein